jgi:two-component system sensor kinase FixL
MNWMTIAWPMVAGACLTLGFIELRIGLTQPQRAARLLFAVSAFTVACISGLELALMRTHVPAEWWPLMRWLDIAVGVMLISLTAFVGVFFGTGNKWLALAVPGLYVIGLSFDYLPGMPLGAGMTYKAFTGFRTVETFGGASFNVAEGVSNPWNVLPYLAVLALIAYVADASVRLWRRGGRRRALVVGGAIVFFFLTAGVHSALVEAGIVNTPYMISWAYLAVLVAMASELNADVLAAAQLAVDLRESERRMDLASAAADLGMWSWDIVHDSIWATSKARALFGFSESAHISFTRFLSALHPEDREAVDRGVQSALAADDGYEAEYRVSLPAGQTRWIAARGQFERDTSGKPIIMRGVVLDISARRAMEVEVQELHGQLMHASRVSMLGQFASALAHELNQPLGAILRNAEAAELFLQHDPPDLDELRAILSDIRQDEQRAGSVIERMRALLKRRGLALRALSVSELLENVAALTRSDSSTRKAQLEIEAAPGLPLVMGDPVHLQQVLLNLVLNAMDAMDEVPAERRKVTVRAQRHGEREVEVAVTDSGSGIAPERLGHLFEPFVTTKPNGMGIGLSISRTIIEAHGGRIWAENNEREGATFRFTVPLAGEAAPS